MAIQKKHLILQKSLTEKHNIFHIRSIKGRWMVNSLSLVVAILCIVVIIVAISVSGYYYLDVNQNLTNRAKTTAIFFDNYLAKDYEQFYTNAETYVSEFNMQDKLELQILDTDGRIIYSSSGFASGTKPVTEDVKTALSEEKTAAWSGKNGLSGEQVMSATSPIYSGSKLVGGVRYVSSLAIVEKQIAIIVFFTLLLCGIFLVLVLISSQYFLKSIVEPVKKINVIAREIAAGRYGMRLNKIYDDEIGELCDTINYMSEEISKAEKIKNDFISSVSHELRTPLTAIGGWSETLIACGLEDKEQVLQGLNIIQKESSRLAQMVEELLDFTRIEGGNLRLNIETFELANELYEAVYMYTNLLEREGIELEFMPAGGSLFVSGDRHRLKQVFLNIIDNAAKYGKIGGKIQVRSWREGDMIHVTVRDFGVGIPENELPYVKQKFFKGSSKERGNGIGLAVTDEIVKLHRGSLAIESVEGAGTLVTVTLPSFEKQNSVEGVKVEE